MGGLNSRLTPTGLFKSLAVIPGHPCRRILGQFVRVFLQLGEVVEGIGVVQFTGVDQTHVQVTHLGTVLGLIEQTILPTTENFP